MLKLPSKVTLIVGLVGGVLVALNELAFKPGPPWQSGINIAIIAIAALGVSPLLGAAWRTALNLTTGETAVVTAVLSFLSLWVKSEPLSSTWMAVINGILAFAAAVGFGPQTVTLVREHRALARRARTR